MLRFGTMLAIVLSLTIPLAAQQPARVGHVSVLGSGGMIEVEIQTSGTVTPQSQMLAGPDRIVVDFPGALPGADLRAMAVNRGALKAIRAGLFSKNPSVTRVVLDLAGPQTYQVFATRNAVMLKLSPIAATGQVPPAAIASSSTELAPATPPQPAMNVTFHDVMLCIHADRVTLAQVLFEVQRQTGAEIAIPAGAEAEEIAAELGPAPAREVLASLLNGSRYNFIFVGNDNGRTLQKAILSVR
jgi:hypothetical protein